MANQTITQLPAAGPITGTELVPIVQNGGTYHTTTAAIANSPTQTQSFLTVNNEPTLPNSRYFATDSNFSVTDNGSLSFFRLNLTGAAASLASSGNGIQVKTSLTTVAARTLTSGTNGLSITNGDGISGNPTFSLTGNVLSLANAAGPGLMVLTGPAALTARSIVGTASEIDVSDGNGAFGNPTVGLADNAILPGSGAVTLPTGNTAARPLIASNGQVRYNSQTSRFEGYQGGSWTNLGSGDGTVTSVDLSGGTTGLTASGGPITTSGVFTLAGTLVAANGGTGQSSYTTGDILYASGTTTLSKLAIGASTRLLTSTGSAPQWTDPASVTVGNATNATLAASATNLSNGTSNEVVYQSAAGTTSFITAPVAADTYLRWNGSGFVWSALAGAGTVTSVSGSGGTTGLTLSGGPITSSGTLTLGGTLVVSNGGTGATTLTGYVKGNGTSAMTASATIPNTDITGLGTISTQSASSVAITGGAIDGTTIGGTTAAAGTFTSVAMTSGTITTPPSNGNDIVNKTYADSIAAGLNFHQACAYATTAALPTVTYNNGTSGVGATLTATANGALVIDGHTFTSPADDNKRVLIKNQSSGAQNGIYTVTQVGDAGNPFILTRATDFNTPGTGVNQIDAGDFVLITNGTANANTSWVQQTPLPITMGTTAIVFAQFGAPLVYTAGTGLSESPAYTFNIATTGVSSGSYGGAATAVTLAINAQGQVTSATDVAIAIAASQITSGTLDAVRGGTGIGSYSVGDLLFANTTTTLDKLTVGANGYVLASNGTAPGYVAQSTLSVGSATTAGSATNATNATNIGITEDTTSSSTVYPVWVTNNTGNLPAKVTSTKLTYVPSTGTLSTTTFSGALNGNATSATTATTATTATNANNVAVALDTTNADYYFGVYSTTTGNLPTKVVTGLTANPSTGKITGGISGGTF